MSSVVRPHSFTAEFREVAAARSHAELEAEVSRLQKEVGMACAEGRARGAADALAQLQAERDTALAAAAAALSAGLAHLDQRFEESERVLARVGAELALDFADHLAARALERDPLLAIDEALTRVLGQVRREQPLEVRVAPVLAEAMERCIAERQAGERRTLHLTVIPDPVLPEGDARVEWDGGALLLDRAARHAFLQEEIAALLAA